MAIEAIKGAGMVYQGSTSTAQVKEESQSKAEVSSKDNQIVSDTVAKETQAMNTKEASGDTSGEDGRHSLLHKSRMRKTCSLKRPWMTSTKEP